MMDLLDNQNPTPIVPPIDPASSERKFRSKRLWLILALVVIIVGAGSVYLWGDKLFGIIVHPKTENYAQTDPLSNLKNTEDAPKEAPYVNGKYGFEFSYPKSFCLQEGVIGDDSYGVKIHSFCPTSAELDGQDFTGHFGILVSPYGKSLEEYVAENNNSDLTFTKAIINGYSGYTITSTCNEGPCGELETPFALLKNQNYIYRFYLSWNQEEESEALNQIISTFKFTDETSQVDISTWKTYTNGGFEIKYPADWLVTTDQGQINFNSPANQKVLEEIKAGKMWGEGYSYTATIESFPSIEQEESNVANKLNAKNIPELILKDGNIDDNYKTIALGTDTIYRTIVIGLGVYDVSYIEHNKRIYEITFAADDPNWPPPSNIRLAFLQSIKFQN